MLKIEKVHQDKRGEVYILTEGLKEHQEITLLSTHKDFARGGCVHRVNNEYCTVLEGAIKYVLGNDQPRVLRQGQSIMVPAKTPHYFIALTDSFVMEWGAGPEEKKERDKAFREIVDKINKNVYQSN